MSDSFLLSSGSIFRLLTGLTGKSLSESEETWMPSYLRLDALTAALVLGDNRASSQAECFPGWAHSAVGAST